MARVPHITEADLPTAQQDLLVSALQGTKLNSYRTVGNNPAVLYGLRTLLGSLWRDSGLDPAQRELVILAVARETDAAYVWHQHVDIARDIGLSDAEIIAISDGQLDSFDRGDRLLVEYAQATVRGTVDDALADRLAVMVDDETVVGITTLASGYLMVARLLDALAVETETPFVGWRLDADSTTELTE